MPYSPFRNLSQKTLLRLPPWPPAFPVSLLDCPCSSFKRCGNGTPDLKIDPPLFFVLCSDSTAFVVPRVLTTKFPHSRAFPRSSTSFRLRCLQLKTYEITLLMTYPPYLLTLLQRQHRLRGTPSPDHADFPQAGGSLAGPRLPVDSSCSPRGPPYSAPPAVARSSRGAPAAGIASANGGLDNMVQVV